MPAFSVNSEADSVVETESMRIGVGGQLRGGALRALEARAIGLHGVGAVEAQPQAEQHRLGGVDHRAAADGHHQVGAGRAGSVGAGRHVLARGVRADGGVGARMPRAERPLQALQRSVALCASERVEVTNTRQRRSARPRPPPPRRPGCRTRCAPAPSPGRCPLGVNALACARRAHFLSAPDPGCGGKAGSVAAGRRGVIRWVGLSPVPRRPMPARPVPPQTAAGRRIVLQRAKRAGRHKACQLRR